MPELTAEQIFNLHPKIRWAGLATEQGEVVFTKMRPGVQSLSPESVDQAFVQLGPMLISGVCERLAPWAGTLETIVSTYEKVVLVVKKLDKRYLALTINRADATVLNEFLPSLERLTETA